MNLRNLHSLHRNSGVATTAFVIFCLASFLPLMLPLQAFGAEEELCIEKRNYEDDAVFNRLSSAKQAILERKYGKKSPGLREIAAPSGSRTKPEILPLSLPANTLVNNPSADASGQNTQSETTLVLGADSTVIAGFNDSGSNAINGYKFTGFARSVNGGTSFTDMGTLPSNPDGDAGDPVMARSAKTGTVFFATLSFVRYENLELFRSTDDGATFITPAINSAPGFNGTTGDQDKEWIAVDNFPGPGFGNVYQFWRNFGSPGGMTFTRSTNDGLTWTPSGGLTLASDGQGAYIMVGADHAVYCFWHDNTVNPRQIKMRKSTDQGVSFGMPVSVASLAGAGVNGDLGLGFRSNSFPQAAASPLDPNLLYLVFNDNPVGIDRGDVYFAQSNDGGATWGNPIRINDDSSTKDNWQPRLALTPDGTNLFVCWYDRRNDPGNSLIDVFGVIATLSGNTTTFGSNFLITDQSFPAVYAQDPAINSSYMGDYDSAVADNNFFYTTWGDNRLPLGVQSHQPDVRLAKIPVTGPGAAIVAGPTAIVSEALIPPNGAIDPGEGVTVNFTLKNLGVATANLVASIQASGGTVPVPLIQNQTYGAIPGGGGTATRPFTFNNTGFCGGEITVTLHLQDGAADLGTVSFPFVLGASAGVPFNGGPVIINDAAAASPYPSTISVSGITKPITRITLTLRGLRHTYPADVDILLVGPGGEKSIVMSDAGDEVAVDGVDLTFDDEAEGTLGVPLESGTYLPTNLGAGDLFPADAPPGPYGTTFSVFSGLTGASVNGDWKLYVTDDAGADIGAINGWSLNLYTVAECSNALSLCPQPTVLLGSLDSGDLIQPDHLVVTGIASSCANPKGSPGLAGAGPVNFDAYTFVNNTIGPTCVRVSLSAACTESAPIFSAAYLGSFSPSDPTLNYLADEGNSPNPSNFYSFSLPSGQSVVIVVHTLTGGTSCNSYRLTVSGDCAFPTFTPTPSATPTPSPTVSPTPSPTYNPPCFTAQTIGYYDMVLEEGSDDQVPPILTSGNIPVKLFGLAASDLAGIDVLFVQNPENEYYGSEYLSRLASIQAAVNAGMVLIIHDRYVETAESILPGGSGFEIHRDFDDPANINVVLDTTLVTHGPGGIVDNATLDGGNASSHGFAVASSLPAGAALILSRSDPSEIVTFSYPYGAGYVVYSSIPLDFYLAGGGNPPGFAQIYAPNVLAYGAKLRCASMPLCPSPTVINGSINVSDPIQSSSLIRDGVASSCGAPKPCPGPSNSGGVNYDAYTFLNNTIGDACVRVVLNTSCTGTDAIFCAAYLGGFNPGNPCANYLADEGNSTSSTNYFSFKLPSGQAAVIVVHGVNPGTSCGDYTLTVTGDCAAPTFSPTPPQFTPSPTASPSPSLTPSPTTSPSPTPSPTPFNSALQIGNSVPSPIQTGQLLNVVFTVRNNGNTTWTAAGGYEFFVLSDPCGMLPGSAIPFGPGDAVPPFTNWDFLTTIVAPGAPASCNLQLRMRQGATPFGATMSKTVTVLSPTNVVKDWILFE